MPTGIQKQIYQTFLDFLEMAEKKRNWSVLNDIPWHKLDTSRASDAAAQRIEIYCSEELYVPDYGAQGLAMMRSMFGMAWFLNRWTFEESKHGFAFREYLTRSGLYTPEEFNRLEAGVFTNTWKIPFGTARQMSCYGALQESATYLAYRAQRDLALKIGDPVLESIFFYVGRDEAAHAGFYRAIVQIELGEDRTGTITDLAHVLANFKMPGDGLIPDYRERLKRTSGGISPRSFIESVLWPLLSTLKISRDEFKFAIRKQSMVTQPPQVAG